MIAVASHGAPPVRDRGTSRHNSNDCHNNNNNNNNGDNNNGDNNNSTGAPERTV